MHLLIVQVIQGLLQASESVIVSKDAAAQLFAHEATRVFHDRLVSAEDRQLFYQFLCDSLHDYFKVRLACMLELAEYPGSVLKKNNDVFLTFFLIFNGKKQQTMVVAFHLNFERQF